MGKSHGERIFWTPEEDARLARLVTATRYADVNWDAVSKQFVFPKRDVMSCKARWNRHLDPERNTGPFTTAEDGVLLESLAKYPKKWEIAARRLSVPGARRTGDMVKTRFFKLTRLTKRVARDADDDDVEAAGALDLLKRCRTDEAGDVPAPEELRPAVGVKSALRHMEAASAVVHELLAEKGWPEFAHPSAWAPLLPTLMFVGAKLVEARREGGSPEGRAASALALDAVDRCLLGQRLVDDALECALKAARNDFIGTGRGKSKVPAERRVLERVLDQLLERRRSSSYM